MTTLLQISINFSSLNNPYDDSFKKHSRYGLKLSQPINSYSVSRTKIGYFHHKNSFKLGAYKYRLSLSRVGRGKDEILVVEGWKKKKKRVVMVRFNQGLGYNSGGGGGAGGGGGGGGRDNSNTARILGNLAFAAGLTYLSMTGQLGWILDTIVSIWLVAVIVPIVGLGALFWWAGRDIVQGTCPNCGNDFQVLKSTLNEDLQLCPFCTQPFSVVDNEFVSDPVKFSNQSTTFGQEFSDFYPRSKKGKDSSSKIVDVEAEIKDAD